MRISKLYLVVCAAALCGSVVTVRADDNPNQAAARAVLEEKMRELNAQPASTNAQTSAPAMSQQPAQPAATTAPATPPPAENPPQATAPATAEQPTQPATTAAAPATPPLVEVTPSGTAVQEPTNPPPAATTMPATPPPAEKPAMTTAPAGAPAQTTEPASTASSSDHSLFGPVPPPSGSIPAGMAPDNMQASTNGTTPPPAAVQQPTFREQPQNANPSYPGQKLGLKPIQPPSLPISPMQQAQLQALLEKYNANAITPEQYQAERANILAEHP
jgi:hypothetical protein